MGTFKARRVVGCFLVFQWWTGSFVMSNWSGQTAIYLWGGGTAPSKAGWPLVSEQEIEFWTHTVVGMVLCPSTGGLQCSVSGFLFLVLEPVTNSLHWVHLWMLVILCITNEPCEHWIRLLHTFGFSEVGKICSHIPQNLLLLTPCHRGKERDADQRRVKISLRKPQKCPIKQVKENWF